MKEKKGRKEKEKGLDDMIMTIDNTIDDGSGGFHWRRKRKKEKGKK